MIVPVLRRDEKDGSAVDEPSRERCHEGGDSQLGDGIGRDEARENSKQKDEGYDEIDRPLP